MMTSRRPGAIYICYLGLLEPLVQTQVLPYLRELAAGGTRMHLLTFEPERKARWSESSIAEWRQRLRGEGVEWHVATYHKRPSGPATLFDIFAGTLRVAAIARREGIDILHGRGHVGAAIASLAKPLTGARVIFDIRGLLPEEYVDSGNWKGNSYIYRWTKAAERWLFGAADAFVVLTERAREALFPGGVPRARPIEVIPCCISAARFSDELPRDRDTIREELGLTGRLVFVYAGSLGGYYLIREMVDLLAVARESDPTVFALMLTQSAPEGIMRELERAGFSSHDSRVLRASSDDVPRLLHAADVAVSVIRPAYPRLATSPTKFGEYLAAGLPVIITAGVGDLDAHVEGGQVGALLRGFDRDACRAAVRTIAELRRDPSLSSRCRTHARTHFDLETVGGEQYRRLYRSVLGVRPTRHDAACS
jgi:glycosyltransferase involved in cell wall biosynthesis